MLTRFPDYPRLSGASLCVVGRRRAYDTLNTIGSLLPTPYSLLPTPYSFQLFVCCYFAVIFESLNNIINVGFIFDYFA